MRPLCGLVSPLNRITRSDSASYAILWYPRGDGDWPLVDEDDSGRVGEGDWVRVGEGDWVRVGKGDCVRVGGGDWT